MTASRRSSPSAHGARAIAGASPPLRLRSTTARSSCCSTTATGGSSSAASPSVASRAATATAGTPSSRGASSRGAMGAFVFDAADARVRDFLDASTVVELATISPSGRPFVTPLWFVGDDGALYVTTAATSRAARNVATHPAVAMLLHGDCDGRRDRVLLLRGTATMHHAFPSWRVLAKLALKYYLSPQGALSEVRHAAQWPLRLLYYADARGGPSYLRIVPTSGEIVPASP